MAKTELSEFAKASSAHACWYPPDVIPVGEEVVMGCLVLVRWFDTPEIMECTATWFPHRDRTGQGEGYFQFELWNDEHQTSHYDVKGLVFLGWRYAY